MLMLPACDGGILLTLGVVAAGDVEAALAPQLLDACLPHPRSVGGGRGGA